MQHFATMSRFFDVTYSEKGEVFGLIDQTFIVTILILSFEPGGTGFKLTYLARKSKSQFKKKVENVVVEMICDFKEVILL